MSGGSLDYLGFKVQNLTGNMEDTVLDRFVNDFGELLRSYEWYTSGDTSRDDYLKDAEKFKKKWLKEEIINEGYA